MALNLISAFYTPPSKWRYLRHIYGSAHKFEKRQQTAVEYPEASAVLIPYLKIVEKYVLAVVIRFVRVGYFYRNRGSPEADRGIPRLDFHSTPLKQYNPIQEKFPKRAIGCSPPKRPDRIVIKIKTLSFSYRFTPYSNLLVQIHRLSLYIIMT